MPKAGKALLVGAAVVGALVAAPVSAFAGGPTNETFSTPAACEARAAQIRDGITGAECNFEASGWPPKFRWRLYVYT